DPGPGLLEHVAGHDADRNVVADAHGCPDPQMTYLLAAGQRRLQSLGLLQQRLSPGSDAAAQLVELQSLPDTIEQLNVELPLQIAQRAAGCGLGHRQALCRAGEVLVVSRCEKDFQLAERVFHYRFSRISKLK